jgi:uncharacterized membrane protein YphA (DoxX/SURF4 family)
MIRLATRLMLAWVFVHGGLDVLRNPEPRAKVAGPLLDKLHELAPLLPDDKIAMVRLNATVHLTAGLLLVFGQLPRFAALALAASLVPTTLGGHRYWEIADPAQRAQQRIHVNKNLAIMGGLLVFAASSDR